MGWLAATFNWLFPLKQVGFGVAVVLAIVGALTNVTEVVAAVLVQPNTVTVKE